MDYPKHVTLLSHANGRCKSFSTVDVTIPLPLQIATFNFFMAKQDMIFSTVESSPVLLLAFTLKLLFLLLQFLMSCF